MNCACHGKPMRFHKDPRYRGGGFYACLEKERAQDRTRYHALDGRRYNLLLLKHRRHKALASMRARHLSEED